MAANIIVTRTVAGIVGASMADEPTVSDKYPAMRFHPTLPPVTVANEEEEKALPDGYRSKVWEEEEAEAWTAQHASHSEGSAPRSRR
jgi:hypothetical protein